MATSPAPSPHPATTTTIALSMPQHGKTHIKFIALNKKRTLPLSLRLRIQAAKYLDTSSRKATSGSIIPLPSNKILKLNASHNELDAMEFVRSRTTIPLPRIYEVYTFPKTADDDEEKVHLVMDCLPGSSTTYINMTPSQISQYGKKLSSYLAQLRSLAPPSPSYVGSVKNSSLIDHRVGHIPFGPFTSIAQFHSYLRLGAPPEQWTGKDVVKLIHSKKSYTVKFTHADLNPSNIMYDGERITGIIDWEFAGWYPEYWEYTKMYFAEGRPGYKGFFEAVEGEEGIGKFGEELEAERDIWGRVSPWGYDDYYGGGGRGCVAVEGNVGEGGKREVGDEARGEVKAGISGSGSMAGEGPGGDHWGGENASSGHVKIRDGDNRVGGGEEVQGQISH